MSRFALVVCLLLTLSAPAQAQILYQTGFEAPTFNDGNLLGQDNWFSTDDPPTFGLAVVQSSFALSGVRAFRIDALQAFSSSWHYRPLNHSPNELTTPIVQIRWSLFIDATAGSPSALWGIDIYDTSAPLNKRIYAAGVNAQSQLLTWDATALQNTGLTLTPNEWHQFRLDMNWRNTVLAARLVVDNQVAYTDGDFSANIVLPISDVDFLHIDGGGEDIAYFDDFAVAALADADADGTPDPDDTCPGTLAGDPTDAHGCTTVDDDGDGVGNQQDLCPGTPACVSVIDADGCPDLDSDNDGAPDGCDNCPGLTEPDQTDTDGDGLGDACDPCPILSAGDLNGDQAFNGGDIQRFTEILIAGNPTQAEICSADFNEDEDVDMGDLPLFVAALTTP